MSDIPGNHPAEQGAAFLAAAGMPRMAARVLLTLVGSPDQGYSASEISKRLGVSAAAVSGAVRYLETIRVVQRLSRSGDRATRFDVVDEGWHSIFLWNAPEFDRLADVIDIIADGNSDAPISVARARYISSFLRYLNTRLPGIFADWQAEQVEQTGQKEQPEKASVSS